jgi:hypothetical protein
VEKELTKWEENIGQLQVYYNIVSISRKYLPSVCADDCLWKTLLEMETLKLISVMVL